MADIREHGLREAIVLHPDGSILDGRNRRRACLEAGVEARFETLAEGVDPVAFVISKNLHRRHLSESQRAVIGARIANLRDGQRPDRASPIGEPRITQQQAADMVGVGKRSVERARKVLEHGAPELVAAVVRDEVKVSTAAAVAELEPDEQREIVARGDVAKAAKEVQPPRKPWLVERYLPRKRWPSMQSALVDAADNQDFTVDALATLWLDQARFGRVAGAADAITAWRTAIEAANTALREFALSAPTTPIPWPPKAGADEGDS